MTIATEGPPPSAELAFSIRGLSKVYHMGETTVHALRGVDLDLPSGEFVVLLGPSGSGKSTLLNIVGGLDRPTAGSVAFRGRTLGDLSERALTKFRRDHVGFIFQFYNLMPSLTARENVGLVAELARMPMTPEEALGLVGLTDWMDHFPAQMSGGQQQRVAVARAVAKRPEVLLCDEPTGALDSETGISVLEALIGVNRELGTTTIVITHNMVIADMADRVVTIADGAVHEVRQNASPKKPSELSW